MRSGQLRLKAQLRCGDDRTLGPRQADLLEAIDREGSISGGGREALAAYPTLEAQLLSAVDSATLAVLSGLLRPDPRPPRQGVIPDTPSAGKTAGRRRKSDP